MSREAFDSFPTVDIDTGVFKYVYIRLYRDAGGDETEEKDLVRGYNFAEYHADVYDRYPGEDCQIPEKEAVSFIVQDGERGDQGWAGLRMSGRGPD